MSEWKRKKYRTLRHFPGAIGRRYTEKYESMMNLGPYTSEWRFLEARDSTAGLVAIDLGANIGEYTEILAKRAKKVYAFEPDPWALEQLRANTSHLGNVEIVAAAAGVEEAVVKLYRHPEFSEDPVMNSQSSSVMSDKYNITQDEFFEVNQIDFLKFMRELSGDIGVLKIDIEGAEVDLFEALFEDSDLMSRIRYIFAETHEMKIPGHEQRVAILRDKAATFDRPKIDLTWH